MFKPVHMISYDTERERESESDWSVHTICETRSICECWPLNKYLCGRISIAHEFDPLKIRLCHCEHNNNNECVDVANIAKAYRQQ